MAEKQLKLLATVYNRPTSDERDAPTETIREGDLFTPKDAAETQRLVESGAAIDPAEHQKQLQEDIDRRQAVLDAQRAQLDESSKALAAEAALTSADDDPANLKGKALEDALDTHGLSKDGTADEKRARLADHLQAQE